MTGKIKVTHEEWRLTMNIKKNQIHLIIGINNLQVIKREEAETCEDYIYLDITFDKTGADDK